MRNKPTFSIVTCTWNSAATLGETLASVAAQSFCDVEHIFVDGGSSDGTVALAEKVVAELPEVEECWRPVVERFAALAAGHGRVTLPLLED